MQFQYIQDYTLVGM